jgi:hydrogenase nickel incorporation protein HypA/HybF
MHELPVTERILALALKYASGQNVTRIVRIHLRINGLSDLEGEWLQNYFDYVSKNTIAENARLVIEQMPIVARCGSCEYTFEVAQEQLNDFCCPKCQAGHCTLISQREYFVENMEVV